MINRELKYQSGDQIKTGWPCGTYGEEQKFIQNFGKEH